MKQSPEKPARKPHVWKASPFRTSAAARLKLIQLAAARTPIDTLAAIFASPRRTVVAHLDIHRAEIRSIRKSWLIQLGASIGCTLTEIAVLAEIPVPEARARLQALLATEAEQVEPMNQAAAASPQELH